MNFLLNLIQRHAGKQNHRQTLAVLLQIAQYVKAILFGHLQVQQHGPRQGKLIPVAVRGIALKIGDGLLAIADHL